MSLRTLASELDKYMKLLKEKPDKVIDDITNNNGIKTDFNDVKNKNRDSRVISTCYLYFELFCIYISNRDC